MTCPLPVASTPPAPPSPSPTPTQYAVNLGDDLALLEVSATSAEGAVRIAARLTGRLDQHPPGPVSFEVFESPRWVPECVEIGDPCDDVGGVGCDGSCALVLSGATARRVVKLRVLQVDGVAVLVEIDELASQ